MAHVFALTYLLTRDDVDEVWLVPTADHVFGKRMASFDDRCAMLGDICARLGSSRLLISRLEAEREGPSRTYDTLDMLERQHPERSFCWVIGADNLTESHRWHRFDDLVARWPMVVLGRPGHEAALAACAQAPWCRPGPTMPDVSSTALRAALAGDGDPEVLRWMPPVIAPRARAIYGESADRHGLDRVWVLGAGSAGASFAHGLRRAGVEVLVWNRSPRAGADRSGDLPTDLDRASLALVAVSDGAIGGMATAMAALAALPPVVLHCAGRLGAEALAPLAARGVATGSVHPLQSLRGDADVLQGAFCAVEGSPRAVLAARAVVAAVGGRSVTLPPGEKAAYHAAAVLSANFLVTLGAGGVTLLEAIGVPADDARAMLVPLLRGTLGHFATRLPRDALTGPMARRDLAAIEAHLDALRRHAPGFLEAYRALVRTTADWLPWPAADRAALEALFQAGGG